MSRRPVICQKQTSPDSVTTGLTQPCQNGVHCDAGFRKTRSFAGFEQIDAGNLIKIVGKF
jgi:hypothetical protein